MYRVLIADDESSVVQSMIFSMPWEELGMEVVGTASNGSVAMEIAQKENIDIAILDIRMPGINGLELCERLRQMNEHIQLIISSGYAEFAYAEKAIQYGVLGYCLKPLDYTQMTRFLRKAAQNLNKNRYSTGRDDLMELLEGRDGEKIQERLSQLGLPQKKYFIAVSIGEKRLTELGNHGVSLRLGRRQWGYILKNPPAGWLEKNRGRLCNSFGIGYQQEAVTGREIFDTFEECIARAYQYFVCPGSNLFGLLDECGSKQWLNAVQKSIKANNLTNVGQILDEISRDGWRYFTVRSALRLCNYIFSISITQDKEDYYIYSVEQLVNTYKDFQEMLCQMKAFLQEYTKEVKKDEAFTNVAFMKLMKYINENYRNEISLTSAAKVLNMNANYVSQLFKKEAGITFVHYITQKRVDDAKDLLVTTQKPLADIALDVGFNDTFYFIKTFKKLVGMTPGQYRSNH